jgi:energy-coupling factor transporter ATP-binding protein EcfA2
VSAKDLEKLRDEGAFEPMLRFDELPIDHVPYEELVGRDVERELVDAVVADTRCVSVIAPSGAGKSSLIAAAANALPPTHPPLKIGVGLSDVAGDIATLGPHVISECRRLLDAQLEKRGKRTLDIATAVRKVTSKGGASARLELALPPIKGLSAKLGAELRTSVVQLEHDLGQSRVLGGLDALVGVFASHQLRPVLIFDDTDQWLGRDERGRRLAHAFFSGPIRVMAKDLNNFSAIIATHAEYTAVQGYMEARTLMEEIEVPPLEPPRDGLARILARRVEGSGVSAALDDVLDGEALVRLEAEYERRGRDLRTTLLIAHTTLRLAGPRLPERLTVDDVRTAVAVFDG